MRYSAAWWERWKVLTNREVPAQLRNHKSVNRNCSSIHDDAQKLTSRRFKHAA